MNTKYGKGSSFYRDNSPAFFHWGDPYGRQREYEREVKYQYGSKHDGERPPKPKPGDKYIVIGLVAGLIVGGALGTLGGFVGIAGGVIAGGVIGATIGELIKKRRGHKNQLKNNYDLGKL